MPGFIGQKLCSELIIIPPNFDKYTAMSERVRAVFAEYDPNYSTASLDEAYLDITDHLGRRCFGTDDERTFPGYSHPELICRCTSSSGMCSAGDNIISNYRQAARRAALPVLFLLTR